MTLLSAVSGSPTFHSLTFVCVVFSDSVSNWGLQSGSMATTRYPNIVSLSLGLGLLIQGPNALPWESVAFSSLLILKVSMPSVMISLGREDGQFLLLLISWNHTLHTNPNSSEYPPVTTGGSFIFCYQKALEWYRGGAWIKLSETLVCVLCRK